MPCAELGHVRDGFVEVRLILGTGMPGLEQQDQFGRQVRDAVWGVVDDLAVGKLDSASQLGDGPRGLESDWSSGAGSPGGRGEREADGPTACSAHLR